MSSQTQPTGSYDVNADEPDLIRVMGPRLLLLFIVGDILGTGVYALTGAGRRRGRRCRLGAVPGRVRRGHDHRDVLPRAGHQVPAGGRRRALHAQGVRHPLRHVPRRLHGDVLGHHLGVDGEQRVRRLPQRRLRPRPRARRHRADAPGRSASWPSWRPSTSAASARASRPTSCSRWSSSRACCSIIFIGLYAITQGNADFSRVVVFETLRRQGRLPRGDRGDLAGVLRDGRLRGLRQHGRGVQGPGPRLPEGDADRARHHRHDLHPGVDHRRRPGPGRRPRPTPTRARRSRRSWRPVHPTCPSTRSSRSSACSPWPTPRSSTC